MTNWKIEWNGFAVTRDTKKAAVDRAERAAKRNHCKVEIFNWVEYYGGPVTGEYVPVVTVYPPVIDTQGRAQ